MIFQPSRKSPRASDSTDGLMSSIDKVKLNNTNIAYGTCATAASTAAKVVKITGNENWDLFPGSIITVKFTYTNVASNPTLNVNDKGAMPIIYNTSNISTSNLAFAGSANRYITYVYTGSAFAFIGWSIDNNTTYSDATTSAAGLMSAADKAKLDETRLWRRCVVGQSSGTTTNPYYKFASISLSNVNYDAAITFKVSLNFNDNSTYLGILTAHVRTSGTAYWDRSELVWEYALSGIDTSKFILVHNTSVKPTIVELWVKVDIAWTHYHFNVLSEGTRATSDNSLWTLYNKASEGSEAALPSGYVQQTSTLGTIKNNISGNAATATNASKVNNHSVESDVPSNAKFTDTWRDVQDNLTSTDTDKSLSANQGKVLKGYIDDINSQLSGLENLLKGI